MPALDRGTPPYVGPPREFATRSLAMAFGLLLHLGLLLILLRPPLPWPLRRNLTTAADHVLRVELLSRRRRTTSTATVTSPLAMHSAPARSVKWFPSVSSAPAMAPAAPGQPDITQPIPLPTAPYGNARFARALDDALSTGLPQLPGANFVSAVPGIVVAPPPSLKHRVHALGKWLNCKNAIFKRDMTDEEQLKRGLTHQQMDQAFQAECVP
jgi:hypothetical protein